MKKELISNLIFGVLYIIIAISILAYTKGYRPVSNNDGTQISFIKTGAINVEADGADNKVYLNDEFIGIAPQRIDGLVPNTYTVNVEKNGYEKFTSKVKVIADNYINIKPILFKTEFGAEEISRTVVNATNYSYKYFKSNNSFILLNIESNTLSVNKIQINTSFVGFFNKNTTKSKFEIPSFPGVNLKNVIWGTDSNGNYIYIYDKDKSRLIVIDIISRVISNSINTEDIINPLDVKFVQNNLYLYDNKKIYKYNFSSKSLNLKYVSDNSQLSVSMDNIAVVFEGLELHILSESDTINDFEKITLKSNSISNIKSIKQIQNTSNLLIIADSTYVVSNTGVILSTIPDQILYSTIDALHLLTAKSIWKYSTETNSYISEDLSEKLEFSTKSFISIDTFNSRNAFILNTSDATYLSDYFLTSLKKFQTPIQNVEFSFHIDKFDNLYLLSNEVITNNSGSRSIALYKL